jgi:hypothetical protein
MILALYLLDKVNYDVGHKYSNMRWKSNFTLFYLIIRLDTKCVHYTKTNCEWIVLFTTLGQHTEVKEHLFEWIE